MWDTQTLRQLEEQCAGNLPSQTVKTCTNCRLRCAGYGFSWLKAFYWQNRSLNFSDLKPSYTKMKRMIWSFGITNVLRNDWVYFPFNQILLVDTPSLPANLYLPGRGIKIIFAIWCWTLQCWRLWRLLILIINTLLLITLYQSQCHLRQFFTLHILIDKYVPSCGP